MNDVDTRGMAPIHHWQSNMSVLSALLYPMKDNISGERDNEEEEEDDENERRLLWIVGGVDPNIGCSKRINRLLR